MSSGKPHWMMVWICLGLGLPLLACSVPVFRYALERWPSDTYGFVVFHEGPLASQDQELFEQLDRIKGIGYGRAPLEGRTVDVTQDIPDDLIGLWNQYQNSPLPTLILLPPGSDPAPQVLWAAPLTQASVQSLLDSPVRREIVERLTNGDTAVWLFLLSGDPDLDTRIKADLQQQLTAMPDVLKLPHELNEDDTLYDTPMSDLDLKIEFSLIPLDLNDPNEIVLTTIIRKAMLNTLDQYLPAAIPIFGKGRALVVLDKGSLVPNSVTDVCRFLVGPCACQANQLNPGLDLLMPVDWDGLVTGLIGMEDIMSELIVPGVSPSGVSQEANIVSTPVANPVLPVAASTRLKRNLRIMAILGLITLVAATWVLKKGASR